VLGTVPSYFVGTKMYMYEDMAGQIKKIYIHVHAETAHFNLNTNIFIFIDKEMKKKKKN
jgi:hypothetical protein